MIGIKIIGLSKYVRYFLNEDNLSKQDIKIPTKKSETLVLFILPVFLGIQKFNGLKAFNRLTQKEVLFGALGDTFIIDNEEEHSYDMQQLEENNNKENLIDLL